MAMRRVLALVLIAVVMCVGAKAADYTFEVLENGETQTAIGFDGSVRLSLPPDAQTPEIAGGNLTKTGAVSEGEGVVRFTSAYYTRKEQGVWQFEAKVPDADEVTLTLPQDVQVVQSIPRAELVKRDSWQLYWANVSGKVAVSFVHTNHIVQPQAKRFGVRWYLLAILAAVALAAIAFFVFKRKVPVVGKPAMSDGQLNVIRAAGSGEATVLRIMLKHNGHIKRNALERESKLSKSSLASVLKNLERKNLLEIDRTFFVHHVSITQWFRDLR